MGLPEKEFDVVRYERHKADKYGKVVLGGNHRYSSDLAFVRAEMIVGIRATRIAVHDESGTLVAEHDRIYGNAPSDSTEPARQIALLCLKPGGWRNSFVRADLSEDLRAFMDAQDGKSLKPLFATCATRRRRRVAPRPSSRWSACSPRLGPWTPLCLVALMST